MQGIQARSLTNRELIRHCANVLELTTTALPYDFQVELLRRFVMVMDADELDRQANQSAGIDPDAD